MKIGIAGLGFMGSAHLNAYLELPDVEVAAVSSANPRALSGDLTQAGGNLGAQHRIHDFSSLRKYSAWRDLVNDPQLDAIDVCLPTDLHAPVSIAALEAGKHVLCEKPMALSADDCDRMMAAAQQHNRVLMIGHVLRFWPEYLYLQDFVHSGRYGPIQSATFVRRCGVPAWSRWLTDESRSGGAIVDLLIHDIDQALLLFGSPQRVSGKSIGPGDTLMSALLYPGGPEVRIQGGWFAADSPLSMSFDVHAAAARLEWTPAGLLLSDQTGERKRIDSLAPGGAAVYQREIAYFLDCCRTGVEPVRSTPHDAARALKLALLLKQSRSEGGEQLECSV